MKKLLLTTLSALLMVGCSDAPKTVAKKEPEKIEPLTGRQAFYKMYPSARTWASDAQALEVVSLQLENVKAGPGKAGAWQATFVSLTKAKRKVFTYSAVEAEGNLHKGVFAGQEEAYTASRQHSPYLIAAFKIDSDEAYKEAEKKSEEYIKKHPGKELNYLLELTPRFPDLTWRVIWGDSISTSDYSIFVDATTGQFLERAH